MDDMEIVHGDYKKKYHSLFVPILYSLGSNLIGEEGAKAIGEGLNPNTVLHTLVCDAYFNSGRWR